MPSTAVQRWGAPTHLLDASIARPKRLLAAGGGLVGVAIVVGEQDYASVPFVVACLALIVSFRLSRRPVFSCLLGIACLSASALASTAKFKHMAVNAHILDVYLYIIKPDALLFVISEFKYISLASIGLMALASSFLYFVFKNEKQRTAGRRASLAYPILSAALAICLFPSGSDSLSYYMEKSHFVSSFFVSIADAWQLTQPSELKQRLLQLGPVPPLGVGDCREARQRPDIVVTLSESMVPPARIPEWRLSGPMARAAGDMDRSLRSFDGRTHGLRVETYGGGTWVSEAQLLTGLSMADLGWRRPYATLFLEGAVDHSLPSYLKQCGYKTVAILPLPYNFVNEGPFLTGLGFDEVLDYRAIGAATKHEDDAVYFDAALRAIEGSRRSGDQPVFLFVLTMAAHSPYDFSFRPEVSFGREPVAGTHRPASTSGVPPWPARIMTASSRGWPRPSPIGVPSSSISAITNRS